MALLNSCNNFALTSCVEIMLSLSSFVIIILLIYRCKIIMMLQNSCVVLMKLEKVSKHPEGGSLKFAPEGRKTLTPPKNS